MSSREKFPVIDISSLSPRDALLKAAKAVVSDHTDFDSNYEKNEKVIAALREAIRQVELEPGPGGWIVWRGGACPVEYETIVDISRACGIIETNVVAGHYSWGHISASADRDITAFRIVAVAPDRAAINSPAPIQPEGSKP